MFALNKFFKLHFLLLFVIIFVPILVFAQQSNILKRQANISKLNNIRALVKAKTSTTLSSQISAEVKVIPFSNGDSFSKGDVLVKLDCRHYNLALKRAKSNLSYARNNRKNKELLIKSKSVGKLEISLAKVEESMAQTDVEMAALPVSNCLVIAPFSGKVTVLLIDLFQFVDAGEKLIHIINTQNFEVQVIVPSKWITWLKPGLIFPVFLDELNSTHKVKIIQLGSSVESVSQTISITAEFLSIPKGLLSGMSGIARIIPQ